MTSHCINLLFNILLFYKKNNKNESFILYRMLKFKNPQIFVNTSTTTKFKLMKLLQIYELSVDTKIKYHKSPITKD